MSTYESDDWNADETITLIGIIKSLKDLNGAGKLDWAHVANQMAESKTAPNGSSRTVHEIRDRFKKLRHEYFMARYRRRSCEFYNYLNDLLGDEMSPRRKLPPMENDEELEPDCEDEVEEEGEEEDMDVEQKYAHTLQLHQYNGNTSNRGIARVPRRCRWAPGEVQAFLNLINTLKLQVPLLRKRNAKVFKLLAREMAKRNIIKRPDQLRVKYHHLRRQYAKAKNGGETFEYYEEMHALLHGAMEHGESSESDSNDSGEEDADAPLGSGSESEAALINAAIPSNARVKWAEGEVATFLDLISSMGLQSALLRKRNAKIFKLLSREMAKRSLVKAPEKLRIKFQHLRRQYNKAKNDGETFEHFEAMHQLLNPVKKSGADTEAPFSSGSDSDYIYSDDGDAESTRPNRHPDSYYWTDHEVDAFLAIIKQQNLFRALDGSKKRNFKTLAHISSILAQQSYQRTPHQLRNKLRLLLRRHGEVKKDGIKNVRMLPRHFALLEELMQRKRSNKSQADGEISAGKSTKQSTTLESDSEASSSGSSCDLLRAAAADSEDYEDTCEMPAEPTPLEVLTSISEGQKQLLSTLTDAHERFLRQQREMQTQFLHEMSNIMRQEREATFRMLRELIQPK